MHLGKGGQVAFVPPTCPSSTASHVSYFLIPLRSRAAPYWAYT